MIFGKALGHLTDRVSVCAFNSVTSTNIYNAHDIDSVSLFKPVIFPQNPSFASKLLTVVDPEYFNGCRL